MQFYQFCYCRTSQFRSCKHLEYQNVKIVKSKRKSGKCKKRKQQNNIISKENENKVIKIGMMCVT